MDKARITADIAALQRTSAWGDIALVRTDGLRGIMIQAFPYPAGWQPRRARFLLEIPDRYPRQRPDAYVPKHLDYAPGPVSRIRRAGSTADWWKWCIQDLPWQGRAADLGAFLGTIQDSLARPNASEPWTHPDDQAAQPGVEGSAGD